ncbi:MAG: DNRLRE domain-containing protein [Proteobacteria bacterium]|nr:DNRLRE domain-containing protein [Pseudomonadota bacterium]
MKTRINKLAAIFVFIFVFVGSANAQTDTSSDLPDTASQCIPSGSTISSATFSLAPQELTNHLINAHRITAAWNENEVTANSFGDSYDPAIEGSFISDSFDRKTIDLTNLVQDWVEGNFPNNGILLEGDINNSSQWSFFPSSEDEDVVKRPSLDICYASTVDSKCYTIQRSGAEQTTVYDTYIWPDSPDQNKGTGGLLFTGEYGGKKILIKFDLLTCAVIPPDCGRCDGKVTALTLRYNGPSDSTTQVRVDTKGNDGAVVFDELLTGGDTFSIVGQDSNNTLGTEITFTVDGLENTRMHTSCSKPIGPGLVSGAFEVIEGYSQNGGSLCPIGPTGPVCSKCEGKITQLTLQYIGDHESVDIKVDMKGKKGHKGKKYRKHRKHRRHHRKHNKHYKNHSVETAYVGEDIEQFQNFTVIGQDKHGTLGTEITLYVNGEVNTKIRTSCSVPIGPGSVFGDFMVIEGYSKKGGLLPEL